MSDVALVDAIKAVTEFVDGRDDWNPLTRDEVTQFKAISEQVFILAAQAGLQWALPQVDNLERQCHDENLPPVQFEGKLNLPGDWNPLTGEFEPVAHFRWMEDMQTLLRLAESPQTADTPRSRGGRPKKDETPKDMLVLAALVKHHGYESGGVVATEEPVTVTALGKSPRLNKAMASRFFKRKYPEQGYAGYKSDCRLRCIALKLALWQGDIPEDAHYHLNPDERDDD